MLEHVMVGQSVPPTVAMLEDVMGGQSVHLMTDQNVTVGGLCVLELLGC